MKERNTATSLNNFFIGGSKKTVWQTISEMQKKKILGDFYTYFRLCQVAAGIWFGPWNTKSLVTPSFENTVANQNDGADEVFCT